jgi:hypothetical protein
MTNISIDKSSDQDITFQYYESDGTTARSLEGATVFFTVKPNAFDSDADDSEATISKTITSHTDAAAGQTTISLTDVETNLYPFSYFYSVKVKESDGKIYTAQSGRLLVEANTGNRII